MTKLIKRCLFKNRVTRISSTIRI